MNTMDLDRLGDPSQGAIALLQKVDDGRLGARQRRYRDELVEQILRGGRHLLGLIDEVLDIAKIEAGRLALSQEPVRISEELQEALDLIEPVATARNVLINRDRQETCHRHVSTRDLPVNGV